jgi:hypothetical protein
MDKPTIHDIASKHDLSIKKVTFEPLFPQDFRIVEYNGLFTIQRLVEEQHRKGLFGLGKKYIVEKWYNINDKGDIIYSEFIGSMYISNKEEQIEPFKDFDSALTKIDSFMKRATYYLDYKD